MIYFVVDNVVDTIVDNQGFPVYKTWLFASSQFKNPLKIRFYPISYQRETHCLAVSFFIKK